ncbi:hypothetical protein AF70_00010240 [Pseudomonas sp. KD5]|uniref:Uncharacterized protein n=1 Tax=Pseudomonas umsongensis TaxID=198618 RepID=A0ACC5MBR1_9PSED|nr:hypothetical protein [Pseudomonas umsongensis]NMN75498.1 hypothetical protein [Pseudomonas sp. KD5]
MNRVRGLPVAFFKSVLTWYDNSCLIRSAQALPSEVHRADREADCGKSFPAIKDGL